MRYNLTNQIEESCIAAFGRIKVNKVFKSERKKKRKKENVQDEEKNFQSEKGMKRGDNVRMPLILLSVA